MNFDLIKDLLELLQDEPEIKEKIEGSIAVSKAGTNESAVLIKEEYKDSFIDVFYEISNMLFNHALLSDPKFSEEYINANKNNDNYTICRLNNIFNTYFIQLRSIAYFLLKKKTNHKSDLLAFEVFNDRNVWLSKISNISYSDINMSYIDKIDLSIAHISKERRKVTANEKLNAFNELSKIVFELLIEFIFLLPLQTSELFPFVEKCLVARRENIEQKEGTFWSFSFWLKNY